MGGYRMQEVYMRPNLEIISFAPQKTIAARWNPNWGYEDNIFGDGDGTSPQEAPAIGDEENT